MNLVEDNLQIVKSFSQEIYRSLVENWGTDEFELYIRNLIQTDKPGFILTSALLKLEFEHKLQFPELT